MGAIHSKIKKLRIQSGITQQETADKLHMHLRTWQKVENGITKLDVDRLKDIAEIFETSVEELINTEETFFINEVTGNDKGTGIGGHNNEITINNCSENERELYERMLAEQKEQYATMLAAKKEQIAFLKQLLEQQK